MVAPARPPKVQIIRVYGLPPQLRAETREQADRLRVAAFESRESVRGMILFPDEISAEDFAEFRKRAAALQTAAATCLENSAELLATVAALNIPIPDKK